MKKSSRLWVVMKMGGWDSITVNGIRLDSVPGDSEGHVGFLPVFSTKGKAVKWNGSKENIFELKRKGAK